VRILQVLAYDIASRLPKNYASRYRLDAVVIESPKVNGAFALIKLNQGTLELTVRPGPITSASYGLGYAFRGNDLPSESYRGRYDLEDPKSLNRLDNDLRQAGLPILYNEDDE
jgi:hypothetical protein